jgi:preprotein translocase subunit SecE
VLGWWTRLKQFLVEVWAELQKTTWPPRKEVYGTTLVVIVTVLFCALYLYVVDLILQAGYEQVVSLFRR